MNVNNSFRLRQLENDKLRVMAEHYGVSKSGFVRYLINKEYSIMVDRDIIKEVDNKNQ